MAARPFYAFLQKNAAPVCRDGKKKRDWKCSAVVVGGFVRVIVDYIVAGKVHFRKDDNNSEDTEQHDDTLLLDDFCDVNAW